MSIKYRYTFDFVKTEAEAVKRCEQINKGSTYYMRKKHPAHFTLMTDHLRALSFGITNKGGKGCRTSQHTITT